MHHNGHPSDDWTAFERMFREHYAGMCAFVRGYVRDWLVAEDIVQETFLGIWQRRATLELDSVAGAYLFTAARNNAINHLRRQGRAEGVGKDTALSLVGSVPTADPEARELADAIDSALDTLPERVRLVFTLRRDGALSNAEIAETLGVSLKAVERNVTRGMRLLRESLAPFVDRE